MLWVALILSQGCGSHFVSLIFTARIRRMGQGNIFSLLTPGGRGTPVSGAMSLLSGEGVLAGEVPQSRGYPRPGQGVPQSWPGWYPRTAYPPARTGLPPILSQDWGIPLSHGQVTLRAVHLVWLTAEDFLVEYGFQKDFCCK